MRKTRSGEINIADIKHVANSRFRCTENVEDLMESIQAIGLLQPIGVRESDNAIIYGNRRLNACIKLGYTKIKCDWFDIVSDNDLLIANITENLKRKNISTIEIGKACALLQARGMIPAEMARLLAIAPGRVKACLKTYEVTLNTKYADLLRSGHYKGLNESFIIRVHEALGTVRFGNKLSDNDWDALLEAASMGVIATRDIYPLRKICTAKPNIQMKLAIQLLSECKVHEVALAFNAAQLIRRMGDEHICSPADFISHIIKQYDKNLLF